MKTDSLNIKILLKVMLFIALLFNTNLTLGNFSSVRSTVTVKAWKALNTLLPIDLNFFRREITHLNLFQNTDIQNALAWIKNNKPQLFNDYPNLALGEITSISYYTTPEGYQINYWLRGEPVQEGVEWNEQHGNIYKSFLDAAIDKLPVVNTPANGHLYRGVGAEESNILKNSLSNGDTYTPLNYYSASYSEDVADIFREQRGGDVLVSVQRDNSKGVNITDFSQAEWEEEVLFKSSSSFIKVNSFPKYDNPNITEVILKQPQ